MAEKKLKSRNGRRRPAKKTVLVPPPTPVTPAVEKSFVHGLVQRGEAVAAGKGELPSGTTHEIVEYDEKGEPVVERRRFSILGS